MGSSTAYQIVKRGQKVLLLEQFDFLHHRGSSHGESRTVRATYPEPYYYPMVAESLLLWDQFQAETGCSVLFKTRQFDMGPRSESLDAVIHNCELHSVPHKVLNAHQVQEEFGSRIEIPEDWVGVVSQIGGVIKPTKAVSMFLMLALKNGAVLKDNTRVAKIERDDCGIVVVTSQGERFSGRKCVLTAGSWMKKMVERVRPDLVVPIQALETSVLYWKIKEGKEDEFTVPSGFPTFASYGEPYIYGTPSLEYPGLIKVAVHGGITCYPERRTWSTPSETILNLLKDWIEGRFGGRVDTSSGPVMTQSCIYSMTPDEDFVIDFLGGEYRKDVVIAGGFSGHGFKMAPAVGRIAADLVLSGEAKDVDLSHFKLSRFGENPKGNPKDFGDLVGNFL